MSWWDCSPFTSHETICDINWWYMVTAGNWFRLKLLFFEKLTNGVSMFSYPSTPCLEVVWELGGKNLKLIFIILSQKILFWDELHTWSFTGIFAANFTCDNFLNMERIFSGVLCFDWYFSYIASLFTSLKSCRVCVPSNCTATQWLNITLSRHSCQHQLSKPLTLSMSLSLFLLVR